MYMYKILFYRNLKMVDTDYLDDDFASVDVGVFKIIFCQCLSFRKNGYVCIKSRLCKIVEMLIFKIGKYGYVKVYIFFVVFDLLQNIV